MRKFLLFACCALGIASCSEEQNAASDLTNVTKRTSVIDSLAGDYKDFQLAGGPAKGWYSSTKEDCSGNGSACEEAGQVSDKIGLADLLQRIEQNTVDVSKLFLTYETVALETFHPTLVRGTIDQFFSVKIDHNKNTNIKYVRFYRANDGIDVGVYPIKM
ncbi:hypothetical protein ACKUSY_12300 [Myroides odoratus]